MIELIFIIALVTLFIHVCFWEGMIFEKVADLMWSWPEWIKKPLFACPICQTPYYGTLIYLLGRYFNVIEYKHPFELILILFAAAGVNTVLIYLISADKEITKELKEDDLPKSAK